jgi:predicted transcriptional regulator of viral defense system
MPILARYNVIRYFPRALTARQFITDLASRGRYHFTTAQARAALGRSLPAVRASLRRLEAAGSIAQPYRGFHVVVPPEYRSIGCLPPYQFVPQLMQHLGEPYYVALLSAGELHGAAHHRPQSFQVMVRKNRRPIVCGRVRVDFVARADLTGMPVVERNTLRGTVRVASAETTALELVGYADRCGGLDNVATVLADLAESVDGARLAAAAARCPVAWSQRLGYLLDLTENVPLADALVAQVRERALAVAPLVRAVSTAGARRSERWKLAINADVEPDA